MPIEGRLLPRVLAALVAAPLLLPLGACARQEAASEAPAPANLEALGYTTQARESGGGAVPGAPAAAAAPKPTAQALRKLVKTADLQLRVEDTAAAAKQAEGMAKELGGVGSSRVDLQACKLEYSIVSPK